MNYFRIRHTLSTKFLGHYPQIKEVKHHCSVWDEPKFIERFHLEKINLEPIVSTPILYAKSKKTDLIEHLGIGFSYRLLVSGKLKNILEKYRKEGVQYFQCPIVHKGVEDKGYWIMNVYETNEEYIDYKESEIVLRSRKPEGGTKLSAVIISSIDEFNIGRAFHKKNNAFLFVERIALKEPIKDDFFTLIYIEGGIGYFVSEKLKQEIEEAGCTGIEFQPSHLTFNEWLAPGGEREKIYGKSG